MEQPTFVVSAHTVKSI